MKPFRCPTCGKGTVEPRRGDGRRMKYRQVELEIPAELAVPTCDACGADFLDRRTATRLDEALESQYQSLLRERALSSLERLAPALAQRDLERLIGVSAGYVSKIKAGKEVSAPLTSLLMLLAADASRLRELEAAWARGAFAPNESRPPRLESPEVVLVPATRAFPSATAPAPMRFDLSVGGKAA